MSIKAKLEERLIVSRKSAGVSDKKLAQILKIGVRQYREWENCGKDFLFWKDFNTPIDKGTYLTSIPLSSVCRLAKYLRVSLDFLLGNDVMVEIREKDMNTAKEEAFQRGMEEGEKRIMAMERDKFLGQRACRIIKLTTDKLKSIFIPNPFICPFVLVRRENEEV